MKITIATWLTLSRIITAPILIYALLHGWWMTAFVLVCCAALTDTCDGFIARLTASESTVGAYLDPLADKVFLVSCYASLLYVCGTPDNIITWLAVLVIIRESVLILGTFYLVCIQHRQPLASLVIRPTRLGKLATVMHCVVLSAVFLHHAQLFTIPYAILVTMAIVTVILMVISAGQYGIRWLSKVAHSQHTCKFFSLLCLSYAMLPLMSNDFVIERPRTVSHERNKLRDTCGELLSEYMELLVDHLLLIAQNKNFDNVTYVQHLQDVEYFLQHGVFKKSGFNERPPREVMIQIAHVQKKLLHTLRCIFERNARSCFVACKTKAQLEKYVVCIKKIIEEEKKYYKELIKHA